MLPYHNTDSIDYHTQQHIYYYNIYFPSISGFSATMPVDPGVIMRMNQMLYPVPEEFKTSGQYYEDLGEELLQDFDDWCCESGTQAAKAERRLERFRNILCNIQNAAASLIRKHYLCYKRKRKMRSGNHFKALRHNGVNYSSVLHLLLKQKWENYLQDKTDNILNYTCERVTEKINRQRAVVLIQRNFRRWSAEMNYEYMIWLEDIKEQERKWEKEREEREMEEANEYYLGGDCDCEVCCAQIEQYRIEMEAERHAKFEEDRDRMREMYFD